MDGFLERRRRDRASTTLVEEKSGGRLRQSTLPKRARASLVRTSFKSKVSPVEHGQINPPRCGSERALVIPAHYDEASFRSRLNPLSGGHLLDLAWGRNGRRPRCEAAHFASHPVTPETSRGVLHHQAQPLCACRMRKPWARFTPKDTVSAFGHCVCFPEKQTKLEWQGSASWT